MKKQILALSLGLFTVGAIAQKDELKLAEKAIKKSDFTEAISAINAAEGLIENADDKNKAKFYFLKGQAFAGKKDYRAAAEAFNKLMSFEKQIGKPKYTNEAAPMLNTIIQDVSKKAINLYNNGKDYKSAAENFYLTYLLSPKDTSFAFNAAVSATQAKDYDTAIKYYRELLEVGYTGIAKQYVATNKETGEVEDLGSKDQRDLMVKSGQYTNPGVETSTSKKADIVKNIALLLREQGKTDEAIEAMKEARKANPKDVNLILAEADLYIQLKQMDKFGELMEEAVQLDPSNPNLYYNLGVVYYNQGKTEEAKKYYEKAIELKPDYADAYMNLAAAILAKDQEIVDEMNQNLTNEAKYNELQSKQKEVYREAMPYLEKAYDLNKSFETVRMLKNIYAILEMESKASEFEKIYNSMK